MYDIEIQTTRPLGLRQRRAYYASSLLVCQIESGGDYRDLRPSIGICLLDAIESRSETALRHSFQLRTKSGLLLTDCLQIHLFELPKYVPPSDNRVISAYGQVTIADATGSENSNSAIANRYMYTGREWDEGLSLYDYRARMYDAVGGRFASRDPIGYEGSSSNLYAFLNPSPILYLDYNGIFAIVLPVVIPAGIGLAALKAAAVAGGVSMFACLMLPECLGRAKGETLRGLEKKLDDLITIRIRPKPEPKWDPPYFPPGPRKDDKDDDEQEWSHYGICNKSSLGPDTYVTPDGGLNWGQAISITYEVDILRKCKKMCEYRCKGGRSLVSSLGAR